MIGPERAARGIALALFPGKDVVEGSAAIGEGRDMVFVVALGGRVLFLLAWSLIVAALVGEDLTGRD